MRRQVIKRTVTDVRPTKEAAEEAVRTLLAYVGEDPSRPGLIGTPDRVVRYLTEATVGYSQVPSEILSKEFPNDDNEVGVYDGMVIVRDISFSSNCEHHLLPIIGSVHIAYIPNGKVVGLSKLARLVDCYARRLQIQEKMTKQIAHAIDRVMKPRGVAVIIEAEHTCMTTRGVQKSGSKTRTCTLLGAFGSLEARTELMAHLAR